MFAHAHLPCSCNNHVDIRLIKFIVFIIICLFIIKMSAHNNHSIGYGPSGTRSRLYFTGNPVDYKVWETRFTNYLYTVDKEVHNALMPAIAGQANGDNFDEKNRRAYAELVQVLDEKSLMLIMNDNTDDGRSAWNRVKSYPKPHRPQF